MSDWFMITVVGEDRAGIVARLTDVLLQGQCNLGEASMIRLSGNFTIMLMAQCAGDQQQLVDMLTPVVDDLALRLHVDHIEPHLHAQCTPDARITVHGADRVGIVAQVTRALADAGLHILDLQSDVAGDPSAPIYIMRIEGQALQGLAALDKAVQALTQQGVHAELEPIELLIG